MSETFVPSEPTVLTMSPQERLEYFRTRETREPVIRYNPLVTYPTDIPRAERSRELSEDEISSKAQLVANIAIEAALRDKNEGVLLDLIALEEPRVQEKALAYFSELPSGWLGVAH